MHPLSRTSAPLRALLARPSTTTRAARTARTFATTRPLAAGLDLTYDVYEPPKDDGSSGKLASEGAPILILHGLFGSRRNNRSISKQLARDLRRPIYGLDLRNHGESPHHPRHDYTALAEDVEHFINKHRLSGSTLIGHSMGAKTVMTVALRSPHLVRDLIPVDNAPVDATLKTDFATYIKGMMALHEAKVVKHSEADAFMKQYVADENVRFFLISNLKRNAEGKLEFKIPVHYLSKALDAMGDFPFKNPDEARYEGRTLIVRGTKSHYVPDETLPIIGRFFPLFKYAEIESGHWVISENPEAFRQAVIEFLKEDE